MDLVAWAVQPYSSSSAVLVVSVCFTLWALIFVYGWFEFVHGLSHRTFGFLSTCFFLLFSLGLGWAKHEKVGHLPSVMWWKMAAIGLIALDLVTLHVFESVTLDNILLALIIVRFVVSTFIAKLDENSYRRWRYLSIPQVVLLGSFLNEGFNCERMIQATSASVPYHAFFEVVAGIWMALFVQTVVTSE